MPGGEDTFTDASSARGTAAAGLPDACSSAALLTTVLTTLVLGSGSSAGVLTVPYPG